MLVDNFSLLAVACFWINWFDMSPIEGYFNVALSIRTVFLLSLVLMSVFSLTYETELSWMLYEFCMCERVVSDSKIDGICCLRAGLFILILLGNNVWPNFGSLYTSLFVIVHYVCSIVLLFDNSWSTKSILIIFSYRLPF